MESPLLPVASTSSAVFAAPLPPPPPQTSMAMARLVDDEAAGAVAASASYKGKGSAAVDSAHVHRLKRSATKVFRCTGFGDCKMTFSRSEHLARHVRKHTGERPFKCHCGREFSRLDNVRQHAMTVHGNMMERNQDTLTALADLHNELSVATVQHQREAGMIVQDPTAAKSRRRSSTVNPSTGAEVKLKPKKERALPKKARAKTGTPAPAAAISGHVDASLAPAGAAQTALSSYTLPRKASSVYAYESHPEPSAAAYGPIVNAYGIAPQAPQYSPAPIHHQEIYGAMAPTGGSGVYPAMEFYSQNSPPTVYPTPPAQHLPATASPHESLLSDRAPSAHDPPTVQYATVDRYNVGYTASAPVTMFSAPPPPLVAMHQQQPDEPPPPDMDPLAGVKVSLPSISALLPASFAEEDHRIVPEPDPAHYARAPYQEYRATQYHNGPTQHSLCYAASPSGSVARPSSNLDMSASSQQDGSLGNSDYSLITSHGPPQSEPSNHRRQVDMHYPEHQQSQYRPPQPQQYHHQQPQQQQFRQPQTHPTAASWYGPPPTAGPQEAYARTASTSTSDRAGPPSYSQGPTSNPSSFATRSPHIVHGSVPVPPPQYSHQYSTPNSLQQQPATQPAHPSYPYPSPVSMGERPIYELQDVTKNGAVVDVEYPTQQRDYSLQYGGPPAPPPPSVAGSLQSYPVPAPAQQGYLPFFPPNSPYANAEPTAAYGGPGKFGSSSQAYAPVASHPPLGPRGGPPPPFAAHRAGDSMHGSQRSNGWPPPPPGPQ
ncbi:hypothetical protein JCM3774_000472 [Rhodotorula dairenensis]